MTRHNDTESIHTFKDDITGPKPLASPQESSAGLQPVPLRQPHLCIRLSVRLGLCSKGVARSGPISPVKLQWTLNTVLP